MNIMKRKNYKRKLISYFVIWSVFISSLLLYSPGNIALSASGAPEIKITAPGDGSVFDVSMVEFTGRISDDITTSDKLSVKVLEQLSTSDKPIDISSEGKLLVTNKGDYGEFSFSKEFSEGMHTLIFTVADEENSTSEITQTFTIKKAVSEQLPETSAAIVNGTADIKQPAVEKSADTQATAIETVTNRPYVVEMNLIHDNKDSSSYLPAEDMTQVPLDDQIRIVIRSFGSLTNFQPLLEVSSKKGDKIVGTEKLEKTTQLENNMKEYVFTFTPSKQYEPSTTYYVYLNQDISNDSGKKCRRGLRRRGDHGRRRPGRRRSARDRGHRVRVLDPGAVRRPDRRRAARAGGDRPGRDVDHAAGGRPGPVPGRRHPGAVRAHRPYDHRVNCQPVSRRLR